MAISALYSAATGMKGMDTQLDVIANNLANSGTTGFKSSRVNFEDLLYEERRQPGAMNSLGQRTSTGLFVGLGSRVSNTQLNFQTGAFEDTGRALDLAIGGQGFFRVQTFDGIGGGVGFTRSGNFISDGEGNMVLGTADGPMLDPPITFPNGTDMESVTILGDGTVTALVDAANKATAAYQKTTFDRAANDIDWLIKNDNAVFLRVNTDPFQERMKGYYEELIRDGKLDREVYDAVNALR